MAAQLDFTWPDYLQLCIASTPCPPCIASCLGRYSRRREAYNGHDDERSSTARSFSWEREALLGPSNDDDEEEAEDAISLHSDIRASRHAPHPRNSSNRRHATSVQTPTGSRSPRARFTVTRWQLFVSWISLPFSHSRLASDIDAEETLQGAPSDGSQTEPHPSLQQSAGAHGRCKDTTESPGKQGATESMDGVSRKRLSEQPARRSKSRTKQRGVSVPSKPPQPLTRLSLANVQSAAHDDWGPLQDASRSEWSADTLVEAE